MAWRSGDASPSTQWSGWLPPVSPSTSARAAMPCRNSSGKVASDASSTPSAPSPFQVKATVTQRLSGACVSGDGGAAADHVEQVRPATRDPTARRGT